MPFWLDEDGCIVHMHDEKIALTKTEARFMAAMQRTHPRTSTTNSLVEYIYRDDPDGGPLDANKVVKQYARRVRNKLKHTAVNIETVWSVGYRFTKREL